MTVMVLSAEGKPGGDAEKSGLLYFSCFHFPVTSSFHRLGTCLETARCSNGQGCDL